MKRRVFLSFVTGVLVLGTACEKSLDEANDPVWAKEPCAHCSMLVTEKAYAAEMTTTDGRRLYFDDVGCMVAYVHDGRAKARRLWVHDATTNVWHDARSASYEAGARTPMNFGFAAHAPGASPISYADMEAKVLARLSEEKAR